MSLDTGIFETLVPSRFITFTFPNPTTPNLHHHLHTPLLRVAVLDSPTTTPGPPRLAAMIVPNHRETDWIFSTEPGHLQLLLNSPQISRLTLIGNLPNTSHPSTTYTRPLSIDPVHILKLEEILTPLLTALSPKSAFLKGLPEIPFLTYEDDVIRSVIVERCTGSFVGEMLVEDVELECATVESVRRREFRRRLTFKRMPNLIQTQLRIHPSSSENGGFGFMGLEEVEFQPDIGALVHPYLTPMVAGLSLIGSFLDEPIRSGFMPKALCFGVGGGALLSFLNTQLGFEVVGVEADEVVLRVARQHFGLKEGKFLRVSVGDGIELIERFARREKKHNIDSSGAHNAVNGGSLDKVDDRFDVVMVDLDSSDVGMGRSAPPLEFVRKSVLWAARSALREHGIIVINVIPTSRSLYESLIREFQEVYEELYEIEVGNGENFVLIATASPIGDTSSASENSFLMKLKLVISGAYMDSIRKL
ncbi:hypothetical protein LguiA_016723 [Lonicera macranthoides]